MFKAFSSSLFVIFASTGCLTPIHQTTVPEAGYLFHYSYEGPTPLYDMADIRSMQALSEEIEVEVQWWKLHRQNHKQDACGKDLDQCFQKHSERLDTLIQKQLLITQELGRRRGFPGEIINEWNSLAVFEIQGPNGFKEVFHMGPRETKAYSLPAGTYQCRFYLASDPSKQASGERTIVGPGWQPMRLMRR